VYVKPWFCVPVKASSSPPAQHTFVPALVAWETQAPVGRKHAVTLAKKVARHDPAIGVPAQNSDEPSAAESIDEASEWFVSAGPSPLAGESLPPVPTSAAFATPSLASPVDPGAPLELPHPITKSAQTPRPLIPLS
jgi:hypothetical protein